MIMKLPLDVRTRKYHVVSICMSRDTSLAYSLLGRENGILNRSKTKSERCSRKYSFSYSNKNKDMAKPSKKTSKNKGFWKRLLNRLFNKQIDKDINKLMTYFVEISRKFEAGSLVFYPPEEDLYLYQVMINRDLIIRSPSGEGYMLKDGYEKIWGGDVVKKIIERNSNENLSKL